MLSEKIALAKCLQMIYVSNTLLHLAFELKKEKKLEGDQAGTPPSHQPLALWAVSQWKPPGLMYLMER